MQDPLAGPGIDVDSLADFVSDAAETNNFSLSGGGEESRVRL